MQICRTDSQKTTVGRECSKLLLSGADVTNALALLMPHVVIVRVRTFLIYSKTCLHSTLQYSMMMMMVVTQRREAAEQEHQFLR